MLELITAKFIRSSNNAELVLYPNKIHLVLDISNSLYFFNYVKLITLIETHWPEMVNAQGCISNCHYENPK